MPFPSNVEYNLSYDSPTFHCHLHGSQLSLIYVLYFIGTGLVQMYRIRSKNMCDR